MSLNMEMDDIADENRTVATASSWNGVKLHETAWTKAVILRVSVVSVLMLLILLGNVVVIVTIVSRAELRHKHVNVFILKQTTV